MSVPQEQRYERLRSRSLWQGSRAPVAPADEAIDYLAAGKGAPLLAFHGALGNAESMAWFVSAFKRDFRVIVPSIGDRSDPAKIVHSVAAVLDAEGVDKAAVFGISFGGLVAQAFLERYPERVSCLILMSCPPLRRAVSLLYHAAGRVARGLPLPFLRLIARKILSRRLADTWSSHPAAQRALRAHRRRLDRLGHLLDRDAITSRFALAGNIHERAAQLHRVLKIWQGPMLLIIASDDPLLDNRARSRLHAAFPDARTHTFHEGGHVIPLFHGEEVRRVIGEFATGSDCDQATAPSLRSPQATPYRSRSRAKIASHR